MNDFKSCYQSAVQDMDIPGRKEFHIDVSLCMDEARHRRRVVKRMQRVTAAAFSTVCVIFVCGFGTAKAAGYIDNVIRVNDWGFESADAATLARNEPESEKTLVIQEELAETENKVSAPMPGEEAAVQKTDAFVLPEAAPAAEQQIAESAAPAASAAEQPAAASAASAAEQPAEASAAPAAEQLQTAPVTEQLPAASATEQFAAASAADTENAVSEGEQEVRNYTSLEEFEKNEDILFPQPSVSIGESIQTTDITVCGDWAMVRYDVDGKVLWLERTDFADTAGHASSKVFPGGVCNERSYTTSQGYTYTLVDSVKEREEEQLQIHAGTTVGSYEAFIDFMGFTQKEAEEIMDSIDLSFYE